MDWIERLSLFSTELASVPCSLFLVPCSLFLVPCSLSRTTSFLEQILSVVSLTRYLVRTILTTLCAIALRLHHTPFFLPPEDPSPVLLRQNSIPEWREEPPSPNHTCPNRRELDIDDHTDPILCAKLMSTSVDKHLSWCADSPHTSAIWFYSPKLCDVYWWWYDHKSQKWHTNTSSRCGDKYSP